MHVAGLLLKGGSGTLFHSAPVLDPDLGAGPRSLFFSALCCKPLVLMGKRCEGGLRTPSLRKGNRKTRFPSTFSGPKSTPPAPSGTVKDSCGDTGEEAGSGQGAQVSRKDSLLFHAKLRKMGNKAIGPWAGKSPGAHWDWGMASRMPSPFYSAALGPKRFRTLTNPASYTSAIPWVPQFR